MGFARFLAPLNEQILELAVQPDSWESGAGPV